MTRSRVIISEHARWQASRRGMDEAIILRIARAPEQVIPVRPGREIRQSKAIVPPGGSEYLVRIVVDIKPNTSEVVTVYRTSKIEKYWREK